MNTHSNFSASCRDQKQPTLDDIIEIDGFNDMSLSERIAAMPTADEATLVRRYCGIPKRREVSEAELDRLRSVGFALRRAA